MGKKAWRQKSAPTVVVVECKSGFSSWVQEWCSKFKVNAQHAKARANASALKIGDRKRFSSSVSLELISGLVINPKCHY